MTDKIKIKESLFIHEDDIHQVGNEFLLTTRNKTSDFTRCLLSVENEIPNYVKLLITLAYLEKDEVKAEVLPVSLAFDFDEFECVGNEDGSVSFTLLRHEVISAIDESVLETTLENFHNKGSVVNMTTDFTDNLGIYRTLYITVMKKED